MLDRVFKKVVIVQMLALFMAVAGMLIDSIIIGRFLGEISMAAYGLAAPILTLFAAIGGTLATGAQTSASKALGQGDTKKANKCLSAAMFAGLVLALAVTTLIFIFSEPISIALGSGRSAELTAYTADYIRGYILGAPGLILLLIGLPFMQLDSDRNSAVIGAVLMTAGDIAFDLMNVHIFKGGMFGMGAASSISVYLALIVLMMHFSREKYIFHISFRELWLNTLPEIVRTGIPYAITQVCRTILVMTLNHLILGIGSEGAVAAYSVVNTVFNVLCIPGSAVGTASVMLSSIMAAEKNKSGLEDIVRALLKYAIIFGSIVAVTALIFARPVVDIFLSSSSPEIVNMAAMGARFIGISMIPAGISCGLRNYAQGIGRMRMTQLMTIGSNYICLVIPAAILSSFLGINGIWISYILADLIVIALVIFSTMIKKGSMHINISDLTFLAKDFGISEENLKEYDIQNMDDVMSASLEICEFCKEHGASLHTRMIVSLAVEEMGTNVVSHAFTKNKNGHLQIRVFCEGSKWTVSVRDDCRAFNPKEYLELHSDDDRSRNIGIRMIVGMSKRLSYINSLDLNNLVLEVEDETK